MGRSPRTVCAGGIGMGAVLSVEVERKKVVVQFAFRGGVQVLLADPGRAEGKHADTAVKEVSH